MLKKGVAAYSDLIVFPDMTVGCAYETDDPGWQAIRFARFTLDWLTDGKDRIETKQAKKSRRAHPVRRTDFPILVPSGPT